MHTIIPGMLMKKTPGGAQEAVMPFGVMGGHFQPMGQTWFLSNLIEYGLDIQEALDLPRLFPYQGKLEIETGIPAATVAALSAMGHATMPTPRPHGGGQAIWIDRKRGVLTGGSDPRKDGMALGY
jgi:gamma-glutamyltranspeptidase/glutathione hydrolase